VTRALPSLRQLRSGAPRGVKRSVRRAVVATGRLTSGSRLLPSFVVAGSQRCGTTSLHRALIEHPAVLPPNFHKGVHYFDTAYQRGEAWYRGHFPLSARAAWLSRRLGAPVITGESSPYYMFHPDAPRRIAALLPGVKALVLLRDPVERAYSHHAHELARGFEDQPFARAVELEGTRLAGEEERLRAEPAYQSFSHQHHSYLARGEYAGQLEELHRHLGRDNVLVLDSESFFTDPGPCYAKVLGFLGLRAFTPPHFSQHNPRPRAPMDPGLRSRLEQHFEPHDAKLAALLGEVPSWRR